MKVLTPACPWLLFCIIVIVGGNLVASVRAEEAGVNRREHPFLICTRSQFPELRLRAEREPWKSMKAAALAHVEAGVKRDVTVELQRYIGACALAYIVDEPNAAAHARRVHEAITQKLSRVDFNRELAWTGTVPPLGAAFISILALDVVYDDLTAAQVKQCEAVIEERLGLLDRKGSWTAARLGTYGTWDIYRGVRDSPDDAYYRNVLGESTADGVTTVTPMYAFARRGADDSRPQKAAYADVLEFTGIDRRYYNDPQLRKFYRWLFSASVTPAREFHPFGDTSPGAGVPNAALLWRVGRFDREAAGYAAWLLKGKEPPGHLLSYVLMTEPLPEPVVPAGQLFETGGAVFREPADSPESLGGALYNVVGTADWHMHEEVNAISAAAYGVRLLVNGGWLGDDCRPPWMNNTIAINGKRHKDRIGGGLAEGLLAEGFDYAAGRSGKALGETGFQRSLILIHSDDTRGGYFIVADELATTPGAIMHHYLQTASENEAEAIEPGQEYRSTINHHAAVQGVAMQVFYATEPDTVEQAKVDSGFLKRSSASGRHYRLEATHRANDAGQAQLLTVIFPSNATHPIATMKRIKGDSLSGATVTLSDGTADTICVSPGDVDATVNDITFRAKLIVSRPAKDGAGFYFARQGTLLRRGSEGFSSDAPVSLHMRSQRGHITSEGATVTIHHPGIIGVQLNGEAADTVSKSGGALTLHVPAGRHRIELILGK